MGFVCIIGEKADDYTLQHEGNAWNLLVRVGVDYDEPANWFVMVGLDVMPGGDMEYLFRLLRVDARNGSVSDFNSGKQTAGIIRGEDRNKVLNVVLAATALLLEVAKPAKVFRVTYDEKPPAVALEKHHAVSKLFKQCGYRVTRSDDLYGKRAWMMERLVQTAIDGETTACFDHPTDGGSYGPQDADRVDGGCRETESGKPEPLDAVPSLCRGSAGL